MSIFTKVRVQRPKRSTFDLTHSNKLTCDMGELVPFMCEEVVPGDTWQNKSNILIRFAPLIAPVMHKISVYTHFFYVPYRLVWDNWESFWSGSEDGSPLETSPTFPIVRFGSDVELHLSEKNTNAISVCKYFNEGTLWDYLNYPTMSFTPSMDGWSAANRSNYNNLVLSALPLRGYQLIYNDYYRDENLIPEVKFSRDDMYYSSSENRDELIRLLTLRRRSWQKDYFTSALPWPQKGAVQQYVPVDTVIESGTKIKVMPASSNFDGTSNDLVNTMALYDGNGNVKGYIGLSASNDTVYWGTSGNSSTGGVLSVAKDGYVTVGDISASGARFSIEELRRASRIQQWNERNARGGSRFIEMLASHFGVVSDDLRLQRPEFIGGGKTPVQISDTLQTSETTQNSPQGQYAGVGFAYGTSNSFKRSFKEPGLIFGILSVMPKTGYMEGCPRAWLKRDKFDFYWPEFARLGEQAILNEEVSVRNSDISGTFGYAPRYAEYKYIPDRVHGEFKTSLNFWNLSRFYDSVPELNQSFIECNPSNRIFAVEDGEEDHLFVEILNNTKARRPMPYLPDPTL